MAPPLLNLQADLQVRAAGEEVGGYVLGELLTQGGMAAVYLGKRVAPGGFVKTVVLKRLRPELGRQPPLLALFLREASLSAALEHPSIVRTLDLTRIDGDYYLVMEYVSGGDLRLLLRRARRRGQRFSVAAALYIAQELLGALEYAHTRCTPDGRPLGLSHRDVSPANILLSAQGEVKLSDFGIAQASAPEAEALGVRLRGKVGYMSPEQAAGAAVDARADLFALAAVLYEVLTDKRLFIGQPGQPAAEIYDAAIVPASQLCRELPPAFDDVLRRALARRREDGYQSAGELCTALRELTRQHGLWLCRLGLAEHLREVCGPDPSVWHCLDERTGTAIIPSIANFDDLDDEAREAESGRHGLVHEPSAEPICDHVITVPWPTVPDKELQQPPVLSADDTVPLPSAVLAELKGSPRPLLPAAPAGELPPAPPPAPAVPAEPSDAEPEVEPPAPIVAHTQGSTQVGTQTRVVDHGRALSPVVDFEAITSPARRVDPTIPLSVAALLRLGEHAGLASTAPPLTTAQLAATLPPGTVAPTTRPLPIRPGMGQQLRELWHRPSGSFALALLALLGLGLALLIASGADVWSWLWTRLHEP